MAISITVALVAGVVTVLVLWYFSMSSARAKLPPGPFPLPVLGNLLSVGVDTHKALVGLANSYGNLFTVWLGAEPAVVLSDPALVNEALNKNGSVYSSRPTLPLASEFLQEGGRDLAFSPYNDHWRQVRRIAHQVLNVRTVQSLTSFVELETKDLVREVFANSGKPFLPRDVLKRASTNVITRTCFGTRYSNTSDPELQEMIWINERMFALSGPNPVNFLPFLQHIPGANGVFAEAAKVKARRNAFIQKKIDQCRKELEEEKVAGLHNDSDESGKKYDPLKMCFVKAVMLQMAANKEDELSDMDLLLITSDIILAGIDTSSTSLEWATYILANNPEVARKAQAELDSIVGPNRLPNIDDIPKLKYLQAFVNELFRYRPVAPLAVPHATSEDHVLRGFTIPKNTQVVLSTWAIAQDPKLFPNPTKFDPERFFDPAQSTPLADGLRTNDTNNVFTFGAGRRICVGMHLGMMELNMGLARMLYCFDLRTADGKPASEEDDLGLTLQPKRQTSIVFTPRAGVDVAAVLN